ncbi:hypothetical protein DWW04_22205 [Phocaeicola dorei]|uniref:Uncharacterized protein n=1 Tax=Phocaeicola dorei TaxID=357276 RepID=A0A412YSP3_9BACT|nr:hypothetical protein DWW04_22205 [Phocaeicola dorei]
MLFLLGSCSFICFDYRVKIHKMSLFSYSACKLFSTFLDNVLRLSTNVDTGLPLHCIFVV